MDDWLDVLLNILIFLFLVLSIIIVLLVIGFLILAVSGQIELPKDSQMVEKVNNFMPPWWYWQLIMKPCYH